jgi:hypothetical protein
MPFAQEPTSFCKVIEEGHVVQIHSTDHHSDTDRAAPTPDLVHDHQRQSIHGDGTQ